LPAGEWIWASMDLSFLATGLLLCWLSWRLRPGRVPKGRAAVAKELRTAAAANAAPSPAAPALAGSPDISTSGA
ncbi:MAG: PepSY domain-containing protein, partial [Acidovorax sp.]